MFPLQNTNFEKYIAIFAAFSVCTMRLFTAPAQIAAGIALLLGIAAWHTKKNGVYLSEEVKGYMKAYGVFVLLTVPSVLFSDKPGESIKAILDYWVWRYVLFAVIAACVHRREYLVNMLAAYLATASVEYLYTLYQVVKHVSPDGRGWGFATGLSIAGIMCILLPVALVILMDSGFEKKLKKVAAFSVISIFVGLMCNKSRGAWLTELIVVPLATFRYLKQNKKYLAVVLAVFLGTVGFMASNPQYVERVKSITNTTTDMSNVGRIEVWKAAQHIIQEHPIAGVGAGRFAGINQKVAIQNNKEISLVISHGHNNFIQITTECGVLGLAGLLYFIGYYLRSSLRNYRKHNNPYDILVFTICFGYIFLYGLIDYTLGLSTGIRVMWFILAVLLQLKETALCQASASKRW